MTNKAKDTIDILWDAVKRMSYNEHVMLEALQNICVLVAESNDTRADILALARETIEKTTNQNTQQNT